jgi:hypothetical protein
VKVILKTAPEHYGQRGCIYCSGEELHVISSIANLLVIVLIPSEVHDYVSVSLSLSFSGTESGKKRDRNRRYVIRLMQ